MLKIFCSTAMLLVCIQVLSAQWYDQIWTFGYNDTWEQEGPESINLNFDTFPPRIEEAERSLYFLNGYSNICDATGRDLFTSNNCQITNKHSEIIINGDSLMQDWELDWCENYAYHPSAFYSMFLPRPDAPDEMIYFNKSTLYSTSPTLMIYTKNFKYSTIKILDDGDNGEITLKNQELISDRLGYGQLTAVKHGNGRDWWLPVPVEIGNKIYMVLLGKDTVYVHHTQNLGPEWGEDGGFQANFSLDGSKYLRYNRFQGVYLYDFDRCDGTLSNLLHFEFNDTTQGIFGGCALSPNNRWMYLADFDYLYQFDLEAADVAASRQLIAVWDGVSNLLPTKFSYIIFGPDGRLYVFPPTTTRNLHVINRPDLPGAACDFRQRALEFPYHYQNTPAFPNFRLGPLDGSGCDTLGIDNLPLAGFRPEASDTNSLTWHFWDISSYQPTQWHWDFGDGSAASQEISPTHQFPAPGLYTVCLTVSNAYGADSHCKVVEVKTVGAGEAITQPAGYQIYPNPTATSFTLRKTSGFFTGSEPVVMYNSTGQVLATRQPARGETSLVFGVESYPPGVYWLRVEGVVMKVLRMAGF
ncbi:MAG: PKD domain-containing protein [Saprospiraceae bacterium]|nr:PKD domain-containing protein [Saprospiraceae bacterium]